MRTPRQLKIGLTVLAGMLVILALSAVSAFAAGEPVVGTEGATAVTRTTATVHGSVNPAGSSVTACVFEYGSEAGNYTETVPCTQPTPLTGEESLPVSATLNGLVLASTYHYRLTASGAFGTVHGEDQSFTTNAAVEGLATLPASAITASSATLNGTLEPNALDTHYQFEYGTSESYGTSTPSQDAGEASEPVAVSAALTGLVPNQFYHYRLVGEKVLGSTQGADETFTTTPVVPLVEGSGSTVSLKRTRAQIVYTINTQNNTSRYHLQYGASASYGQTTTPATVPAAVAGETVYINLEDLTPGTLYHYRLQATNSAGSINTPDQTFTTNPPTPPVVATGSANTVGQNNATITGSVNPQGEATTYGFEIGTGEEYGAPTGLATTSSGEETVGLALTGLQPGTTYHYRITATNADGTTYGSDQTFTTTGIAVQLTIPPAPPLITTPNVTFPTLTATATNPATKPKPKKHTKKKTKKHPKHTTKK